MQKIFDKTNAPYIAIGSLAALTLLASGIFAAAPYVDFLASVAALNFGFPFIIGCAVFSAAVIAFSVVAISKNTSFPEKEAKLTENDKELSGQSESQALDGKESAQSASQVLAGKESAQSASQALGGKESDQQVLGDAVPDPLAPKVSDDEVPSNPFQQNAESKEAVNNWITFRLLACATPFVVYALYLFQGAPLYTLQIPDNSNVNPNSNPMRGTNLPSPGPKVTDPKYIMQSKVEESHQILEQSLANANKNFNTPENESPQYPEGIFGKMTSYFTPFWNKFKLSQVDAPSSIQEQYNKDFVQPDDDQKLGEVEGGVAKHSNVPEEVNSTVTTKLQSQVKLQEEYSSEIYPNSSVRDPGLTEAPNKTNSLT